MRHGNKGGWQCSTPGSTDSQPPLPPFLRPPSTRPPTTRPTAGVPHASQPHWHRASARPRRRRAGRCQCESCALPGIALVGPTSPHHTRERQAWRAIETVNCRRPTGPTEVPYSRAYPCPTAPIAPVWPRVGYPPRAAGYGDSDMAAEQGEVTHPGPSSPRDSSSCLRLRRCRCHRRQPPFPRSLPSPQRHAPVADSPPATSSTQRRCCWQYPFRRAVMVVATWALQRANRTMGPYLLHSGPLS